MKIVKDNIEVEIERPLTKLRKDLSESKIDFSSISTLKGEKDLLKHAFYQVWNESIKD